MFDTTLPLPLHLIGGQQSDENYKSLIANFFVEIIMNMSIIMMYLKINWSNMKPVIAVVDDEPDILELLSITLTKANFKPELFSNANDLLEFLTKENCIILDINLIDMDGYEICKFLKKDDVYSTIPIIMLSARGEEIDKVLGLELGADDYITKPFSPRELVARIKSVLRRVKSDPDKHNRLISIDEDACEIYVNGKLVELTATEFKILTILAKREGVVFSREMILDELWGNQKAVVDRTIDVHIRHLREKLGEAGNMIKNVRGIGYKFVNR